jgi:hypothetical protein
LKVSGFQIMDRLEQLKEQGATVDAKFTGSLHKFSDEVKQTPMQVSSLYEQIETKVADLQEAQSKLNLKIKVKFADQELTLEKAIKMLGVLGRIKNQWKVAAGVSTAETKRGRRSYYDPDPTVRTRDENTEVAVRQVSEAEAQLFVTFYTKYTTELKQAIRAANAREVDIDLDPSVFEDAQAVTTN